MPIHPALRGAIISLLLLFLAGCGRDAIERVCTRDSDCVEGRVCRDELCLLPDGEDIFEEDAGDAGPGEDASLGDVDEPDSGPEPDAQAPDSGEPDATGPSCDEDRDCSARESCVDNICVERPECVLDEDCDEDELCLGGTCAYSPECEQSSECDEGYECVGGQCFEEVCRGADDCEDGEICDAGECVEPQLAATCFVAAQNAVVSPGQHIPLHAFALDQDENGLPASFEWTSSDPDVASIDDDGRNAVGEGGEGTTTITAKTDTGVECDGEIVLTGQTEVVEGDLRVVVIDAESGAAIDGATVVIGDDESSATTDSSGIAQLTRPDGDFNVSVFSEDYNFVSVVGVSGSDLRIPLSQRQGSGPTAGFTGEFDLSQINTSGDISIGLAGASIAGGLLDLNLQQLLGESFMSELSVPGMGGAELPLPGGLVAYGSFLGMDVDIKQTYYAAAAEGARLGWGLAGRVPLMEMMDLFRGGDAGALLTTLLPLFNRFDYQSRPLNLTALPRVPDVDDINGNGDVDELIPDYENFPEITLRPSIRQSLMTNIGVSNLPEMSAGPASVAVLVGGIVLDGPGFVPLGISATGDEDGDGRPDLRRLTLAPPSGTLAGGRLAVVSIAFEPSEVGITDGINLPDEFSVSLWNGQSLPADINLGTFPDASTGEVDVDGRSVRIDADAGPLYRVRMVGQDRAWDVWAVGPEGSQGAFEHEISVPQVSEEFTDLFETAEVFVDAIAAQITIDQLVGAAGVGLERAGLVSTSFNRTKLR